MKKIIHPFKSLCNAESSAGPKSKSQPVQERREVLKLGLGLSVATAATLHAPAILSQSRAIKVGSYGGYFEDSFKKHIYPAFTEATGIVVESVTQPNSADWLVTMQQAASAGSVPADLSLYSRDTMLKAARIGGLLASLDASKISTSDNLDEYFLFSSDSEMLGVGAMSWFTSMVVNPEEIEAPASWAEFWDSEKFEASLGMSKLFNSNLLDVVAATFFDGEATMNEKDGIVAVVEKASELKTNVALWWSAESQMEQAMKNNDVVAGMYYHDVASLMAAEGFPIASVFPKEGNPQGYGSWCLSDGSGKSDEAHEFIAFTSDPATQALMSRMIGTAPLVAKEKTDLTDEEFAGVSGSPAITPAYESYLDNETFIKDTWDKMLAAS